MKLVFLCANYPGWLSNWLNQASHWYAKWCETGCFPGQKQCFKVVPFYLFRVFDSAEMLLVTQVIEATDSP